jgi:hypothetical protein
MSSEQSTTNTLKPLKITCTSTKCEDGLHCFKRNQRKARSSTTAAGSCRACGVELVDWNRIHARNAADIQHTVKSLKHEYIRHHYWHEPISEKAVNYARRKGLIGLKEAAEKRITTSVGLASEKLFRDGTQTPVGDDMNALHYAQHAMACCCRKCIEYWHGIPSNQDLKPDDVTYFTELMMHYLNERIPNVTESGEKVPSVRRKKKETEEETLL